MVDALSPAGVTFRPVSRSLGTARIVGAALSVGPFLVTFVVLGILISPWFFIGAGVMFLLFAWLFWLIPRQVRALGYATTDSDFLVRRGIMFRRLDIVPYGRIQFVDVNEGPVARHLGIASCQLHTASASTDAAIAGLPVEEAASLRDLLVANGASELSGL